MRLHQAMIFVKDLAGMTDFYTRLLGGEPVADTRMPNWVEFATGLALHAIPSDIANHVQNSSPPRPREQNPIKLIFEVDDLESARTRLESMGVPLLSRAWGAYEAVDPEGNIFGFRARHV